MKRRHLHFVIASLSLLLTIAVLLLIVTYRNGSSNNSFGIELEDDSDTSRCNINAQIARDLAASDLLFIADQREFPEMCRTTIADFLDYWSEARTDKFDTVLRGLEKITLILNIDSTTLSLAGNYMESWDYRDIAVPMNFSDSAFTTADLEFYWHLGNVQHRLSAARVRDAWWNNVEFKIEPIPNHCGGDFTSDSTNAVRLAENIRDYRSSHPNESIIAFFDAPLLYRRLPAYYGKPLMATSMLRDLESDSGQNAKYTTVAQADRNDWPFSFMRGIPECDFVLLSSSLENAAIYSELPPVFQFDLLVLRSCPPDLHLPISAIPSMNVARAVVNWMPTLIDSSQSESWLAMTTYLDAVSGSTPLRINWRDRTAIRQACTQWQTWVDTTHTNVVDEISSLHIWTRLIDKIAGASNLVSRHYDETLLSILPGAPALDVRFETPTKAERAAQLRGYLSRNRDKIVVRMLINVLWVGDSVEKRNALSALSRDTGMQFHTAAEWSQWYRDGRPDEW